MTATPFQPKADVAEWRLLFDAWADAGGLEPGTVLPFSYFDDLLDRPFLINRQPFYRARLELERVYRRTLVSVPGTGYRVAEAREHEDVGKHHERKSKRQLRRAVQVLHAADRTALKPDEAARVDRLELHVAALMRVMAYDHARIDRHERALRKAGLLTDDDTPPTAAPQLSARPALRRPDDARAVG